MPSLWRGNVTVLPSIHMSVWFFLSSGYVFSLEKTSVLAAALISELDITAKTEYNNALLAKMQREKE